MLKFQEEIFKEVPNDDSCDYGEQLFLYGFIRAIKPKRIFEIGTHKGLTTLIMAHALYDDGIQGKIITCDPNSWDSTGNFRKFPELEKLIEYHNKPSLEMNIDEVDFIFFDGMHDYEYVSDEIKKFIPKLSKHGVAVFHDCAGDGTEVGSNRACLESLHTVWLPSANCMRIYCKLDNPKFNEHATKN